MLLTRRAERQANHHSPLAEPACDGAIHCKRISSRFLPGFQRYRKKAGTLVNLNLRCLANPNPLATCPKDWLTAQSLSVSPLERCQRCQSKIVVDISSFQCYIIYVRRGCSPRSKMAVDFKTFISVVPHVTAVCKPVLVAVVTALVISGSLSVR